MSEHAPETTMGRAFASAISADVLDRIQTGTMRTGYRNVPFFKSPFDISLYLQLLSRYVQTGVTPQPCHALRSSCFVDPWGSVYPCITYARPVGRLRDTGMDLAPIWRSDTAAGLQDEIWKGSCPQCWTACEAYQSILGNALAGRCGPRQRLELMPSAGASATSGRAR